LNEASGYVRGTLQACSPFPPRPCSSGL
jgi:hypothetical protein